MSAGASDVVLPVTSTPAVSTIHTASRKARKRLTSPWASLVAVVLAVLWTIPTFGLLITSFRPVSDINRSGWWTFLSNPSFTLDNYREALSSNGGSMGSFFVNSIVITIPAVLLPLSLAALAAYVFAWVDFKWRNFL